MQQTQRRMLYLILLAAGFAWILISADRSGTSTAGKIPAPQAGFLAPDFALQTTEGKTIKLSELRGQPVLVNLWATWCPPCRAEMKTLETVYNDYKDQGLIILAVNMTSQDQPEAILPFVQERSLTYPILLDAHGEVASAYQMKSLPSSFFINRDGTIHEVVIGGPMAEATLRTRIEEILK
jgi:cytochrome c biogenesis protein CcmG, thiol:disulfide interchange protein DsbE